MPKKVVEQDLIPIERQIAAFPDGVGMAELEAALAVRGGPKIGRNDPCPCGQRHETQEVQWGQWRSGHVALRNTR